jgi:hypothetical protein
VLGKSGKKICCSCPQTKQVCIAGGMPDTFTLAMCRGQARDLCVVEKGEENCAEIIEAHKVRMGSSPML